MKLWLLDTGPIVAYLDAAERVAECLDAFRGQLVTSSAVVVEAMHFVGNVGGDPGLLLQFLLASQTEIVECTSPSMLADAVKLMEKYADTPMDFADATLVLLAEKLSVHSICTLDRRGFRAYRIGRRKAFKLVLDG